MLNAAVCSRLLCLIALKFKFVVCLRLLCFTMKFNNLNIFSSKIMINCRARLLTPVVFNSNDFWFFSPSKNMLNWVVCWRLLCLIVLKFTNFNNYCRLLKSTVFNSNETLVCSHLLCLIAMKIEPFWHYFLENHAKFCCLLMPVVFDSFEIHQF